MKIIVGVLFMVLVSSANVTESASINSANAVNASMIFKRLEHFYSDISAGRLDEAMPLYTRDAEIILPGQPVVAGSDAIRKWWAATLHEYDFQVSPEFVEATDVGNAIVLRGRAVGQLVSKSGGAPVLVNSWFLQVYRRQTDGSYLFWRGASGPNPPKSNP